MAKKPDSLVVREEIETDRIPPVWLWTGPEAFLKDELFDRLANHLVDPSMASLNVSRYRAGDDPTETVLTAIRTLPMLSARRVVLLKDVEGLDRGEREALVAYVASPVPETALVITGGRGPRDSLYTRLSKAGAKTAVFWTPFEEQTLIWIRLRFKDLGFACVPDLARLLLEACGGGGGRQVPLSDIAPEIEKVALSAGGTAGPPAADAPVAALVPLTEDHLRVVARKANETLLYAMLDRVDRLDFSGAVRALDGALLFRDNTEVRIVATLALHLGRLAWVRDLLDSGMPPRTVQQETGVWASQWGATEQAARRFKPAQLHHALVALADADRTLKSTSRPGRIVLERTLAEICL